MRFPPQFGRAALLGLFGVGACDIADFASSPKTPIFEQTWDLPAKGTSISVASLLPPGVAIYSTPGSNPPDSSAFLVDITTIPITRRVGDDCAQCQTLNGTNAIKPAFVLATGSTQPLPQDMVSGTVLGGTLRVTLTNGMSFDPLFVRTAPPPQTQGYMVLVVRSGSLVLGRDSVNGATQTFAPGSQLVRTINISTGTVTNGLTVDVTLNSPQGDHNEFINANGTLSASATLRDQANPTLPTLRVGSVSMNVVNRTMSSVAGDSLPFDNLEESMANRVQRGDIVMTITNPFAVTGNVDVRFAYGPQPSDAITKTVSLPSGAGQVRTVSLNNAEIQQLVGKKIGLSIAGGVNSTAPITVTPKQIITIDNRVRLVIHVGGN
jgi:hypothetical protein